ncbi:hypothetical protein TNCV_2082751 [Trichonephila clavipes]|nr:hypothetical protein TNCV_2082751 [Trichonephila clavipes]
MKPQWLRGSVSHFHAKGLGLRTWAVGKRDILEYFQGISGVVLVFCDLKLRDLSPIALALIHLVVRASDSRPEGLGSMPDATKHPRSTCSLNQWVRSLVGLITSAGTGEYFPPLQFTCRNCGGGDRGRVAIYRPFGEFRRAKSHCHLYGAQGQRQAYLLPMPR